MMIKKKPMGRKEITNKNELSEIRVYTLGGHAQKVLIEGKKKKNPIFIFLHGGPGLPIPFCFGCRGLFPQITNKVTMVYWDQLGCGVNNHIIDNDFTIQNYVDMTIELIKNLKKDFPNNQISLMGVSWGSILAVRAANIIPDLIKNVIVYGQALKGITFNRDFIGRLEKSKMSLRLKKKLVDIKNESELSNIEDFKILATWVQKYVEGYYFKSDGKIPILKIIMGILTSPDYSLKDKRALIYNGFDKNNSLLKEIFAINLTAELKKITIPYLILQGDSDIITSTEFMKKFIKKNKNTNLFFEEVPQSGHIPSGNGIITIMKLIFDFIKTTDDSKKL